MPAKNNTQTVTPLDAFAHAFAKPSGTRRRPRAEVEARATAKAVAAPVFPAPPVSFKERKAVKVSEGMQLAAGYKSGSGADCPFCSKKGLISPSNGVVEHPKRDDVMKQTFAACKHTINVTAQ